MQKCSSVPALEHFCMITNWWVAYPERGYRRWAFAAVHFCMITRVLSEHFCMITLVGGPGQGTLLTRSR